MKVVYPDYSNNLVNLMSSIRQYFNLPTTHSTLPYVDEILNKGQYRTVVVMLMDGMGSKILDKHLSKNSFLQSNKITDFLSTFPSTTAAATTCVRTCKTPIETGWMGWHLYFDEIDADIIPFKGEGYYDENLKFDPKIAYKICPFTTLTEELKSKGYKSMELFPKWGEINPCKNFDRFLRRVKLFAEGGNDKQYMYAYWDEPDYSMHEIGTMHKKIDKMLKSFDKRLERLSKKLPEDSIVFVIADHGHIDVDLLYLTDYPDILDCLVRLPTVDSRNSSFYVKEDKKELFEELFNKYFKDYYKLISRQEVLDQHLFGDGVAFPRALNFIGDYQAVAIDKYVISGKNKDEGREFVSAHAGIVEDEMIIPLIKMSKH